MHILVTRPGQQSKSTLKALEKLGHSGAIQPLLEISQLANPIPTGPFGGLIITSSNALPPLSSHAAGHHLEHLHVLTTGKASADATQRHGFASVDHMSGSALDLVEHVPAWMQKHAIKGKLLYPCAETTAHDLKALLKIKNIDCESWPVYRAQPVGQLSSAIKQELVNEKFDGVLLYSQRTAHTFVQLMRHNNIAMKGLRAYAMSRDIINVLPKDLQSDARYPTKPRESDLLNLIGP